MGWISMAHSFNQYAVKEHPLSASLSLFCASFLIYRMGAQRVVPSSPLGYRRS